MRKLLIGILFVGNISLFASELPRFLPLEEVSNFGNGYALSLSFDQRDQKIKATLGIFQYWKYQLMGPGEDIIKDKVELNITFDGDKDVFTGEDIVIEKYNLEKRLVLKLSVENAQRELTYTCSENFGRCFIKD